jgi:hypothetical protein
MRPSTTDDLLKELLSAKDIETFLSENEEKQISITLAEYLSALLGVKGRKKADVIRDAQLDTIYGYQIFQGKKSPARDKLLQLVFGFPLNLQEAQKLLHIAKTGSLYVKDRRDSIIIFALEHSLTLIQLNELLYKEEADTLF